MRRLELGAVAGRLWISWCVLDGADFFVFFFSDFCFFLRTHSACCKYEAICYLIYLFSSNDAVFLPLGKKPLHTGVRTGCHYLTVCVRV